MVVEEYDTEFGYSLRGLGDRYSLKAYELRPHEIATINEVKKCIKKNVYNETSTVLEHLSALNSLLKKMELIALSEERAGLVNWELKSSIDEVRALCDNLIKISASLPLFKLYRIT
jgi:hypothetical protein